MIGRLGRYVLGSYPPVLSTLFAVCWAYGVTGLFATVDPHAGAWRPDLGTAVAALTLIVDLLLMRAIDDIRDLDYDRAHSPGRPLASGAVSVRDLLTLYAIGTIAILALNLGRGSALAIIAVQIGYALLVLAAHHWLHWPDGDNLPITLLISAPAQLLIHFYLYAGYLRSAGHPPDASIWPALAVVLLASLHLELAKKIVRVPAPGERTYVTTIGLRWTVGLAMVTAVASAVLLLATADRWSPWVLLVLAPLMMPLAALVKFRPPTANRWKAKFAAFYLLATFAAYAVAGVASN